jgi:hypothetical protein
MNSRRLFDESTRASSVGREADRLGGYKIDDHFEGRRLHHRKIGGLLALKNAAGIEAGSAARLDCVEDGKGAVSFYCITAFQ